MNVLFFKARLNIQKLWNWPPNDISWIKRNEWYSTHGWIQDTVEELHMVKMKKENYWMVKFSLRPLSAWLQPDRSNAVGIVWVTRVSQPDAETHKSDGASHCMGYFIQQHENMCAHRHGPWVFPKMYLFTKRAPGACAPMCVCVCVGLQGLQEHPVCDVVAWYAQVVQERPCNRWTARRRPDAGVLLFPVTGYKRLTR